jgi:paired box protein 2
VFILFSLSPSADENRDINIHHIDEDIKRQRIQYNGDQIYPNVSQCRRAAPSSSVKSDIFPQIWSSKWCVKDEPKQQQQQQQLNNDLIGSPVVSISTPPHNNNNNTTNNSNTPNNASTANNGPNNGSSNNNSSYYDTHNVFPTSVNNNNNQDTILYDSITSISQAQNTLYAPSIGTAIGKLKILHKRDNFFPATASTGVRLRIDSKMPPNSSQRIWNVHIIDAA